MTPDLPPPSRPLAVLKTTLTQVSVERRERLAANETRRLHILGKCPETCAECAKEKGSA